MKRWNVVAGVVAVFALAVLYYAISPLFRTIKVDEATPVAQAPVAQERAEMFDARSVEGTIGHPASGTARIVESGGKTYVRYENFKTINGPDLFIYLAKDKGAKEFVNLGALKATEGNVNYEIPASVNVAEYPYVLTWCKTFGVLFNSVRLI